MEAVRLLNEKKSFQKRCHNHEKFRNLKWKKLAKKKREIEQCLKDGMSPSAKKHLRLRFPEIDSEVSTFFEWLREQRAPISMSLILERARKSAENHNYSDFQASRGWMQKFLKTP